MLSPPLTVFSIAQKYLLLESRADTKKAAAAAVLIIPRLNSFTIFWVVAPIACNLLPKRCTKLTIILHTQFTNFVMETVLVLIFMIY